MHVKSVYQLLVTIFLETFEFNTKNGLSTPKENVTKKTLIYKMNNVSQSSSFFRNLNFKNFSVLNLILFDSIPKSIGAYIMAYSFGCMILVPINHESHMPPVGLCAWNLVRIDIIACSIGRAILVPSFVHRICFGLGLGRGA